MSVTITFHARNSISLHFSPALASDDVVWIKAGASLLFGQGVHAGDSDVYLSSYGFYPGASYGVYLGSALSTLLATYVAQSASAPYGLGSTSLAYGIIGTPYSVSVPVTNSPTSWTLSLPGGLSSAGSLPGGLSLNTSTGVISGTPTTAGLFSFYLTASNSYGSDIRLFTISVDSGPPVGILTGDLSFERGTLVSTQIYQNDSSITSPAWEFIGLPRELIQNAGGQIEGRPTELGVFPVLISVFDTSTFTRHDKLINITITHGVPVISAPTLNDNAVVGKPYVFQLSATDSPSYWVASGLPAGFSIDNTGLVTGTPAAAGSFAMVFTAQNEVGTSAPVIVNLAVSTSVTSVASTSPFELDGAIDVFWELQSKAISFNAPAAAQILNAGQTIVGGLATVGALVFKQGETLALNIRVVKGGIPVGCPFDTLEFVNRASLGGGALIDDSTVTVVGTGTAAYYRMYPILNTDPDDFYDADAVEQATAAPADVDALGELKGTITASGVVVKSETFAVQIKASLT